MPFRLPYAVNATILHEFDTDHLNIWITFRFPMTVLEKPPDAKWIVEVDDIVKAVTASAWQDMWTILLTVDAIASIPDRVTVEYDGPDIRLTTTWGKQWEPWGPILSADGSLLPNGNYKGNEIDWQQAAAQNVWYPISDADISASHEHKMTFQNNQEFKIEVSGIYTVSYYITVECSIANKHVLTAPLIDGTEQEDGQMHHEFARANEESGWSAPTLLTLAVDELVSVGIMTPDIGNPTLMVDHIGLTVIEIGRT